MKYGIGFLALLVFFLTDSHACVGQSVPAGKQGYRVTVTNNWPMHLDGAQPFKFKIAKEPRKPSLRDEVFTVTIESRSYFGGRNLSDRFSRQVTLPAGALSVESEIIFNNGTNSRNYMYGDLMLSVESGDGNGTTDASDLYQTSITRNYNQNGYVSGSVLHLGDQFKSGTTDESYAFWRGMPNNLKYNFRGYNVGMATTAQAFNAVNGKVILGLDEAIVTSAGNWLKTDFSSLPENWIGLTGIDTIVIDIADLKKLCKVEDRRTMLENWVAAGGQLIVGNPQNDFSHVPEIFPTLLGNNRPVAQWEIFQIDNALEKKRIAAIKAEEERIRTQIQMGLGMNMDEIDNAYLANLQEPATNSEIKLFTGDGAVVSSYMTGAVAGVKDIYNKKNRFGYERITMAFNRVKGPSIRAPQLNLSTEEANISPIPDVGDPPIGLFGTLIFGFLFLIGPIIILLIRHAKGKKQHLFFMVPVFSFLTCVAILGYSVITNLGTQWGRAETITILHPVSGTALTNTASAYYCGDQPDSYAYNPETLVGLESHQGDSTKIITSEEGVRISGTRIAPRRVHVVTTQKVQPVSLAMRIKETPNSDQPTVVNQLGTRVHVAAVKFNDKVYMVFGLDDGESAVAEPFEIDAFCVAAKKHLQLYRPEQSIFGKSLSDTLFTSPGMQFSQSVANGFNRRIESRLSHDGEYVAAVEDDLMAKELIQPFNYKIKNHIIYGKY